ncbi:unnamed protein product [Urochloa humidicola]
MDTEKNGAGKCSFSVVRVCAKILVSSARDAAERDEEKADADLAQGMKELSLLGEKKDVSARVGCVSKGMLSEVQNKVPHALPAGSEASACLKYAVTGKTSSPQSRCLRNQNSWHTIIPLEQLLGLSFLHRG